VAFDDFRSLGRRVTVAGLRPEDEFLLQFRREVVDENCFFFRIVRRRHIWGYLYQNDRKEPRFLQQVERFLRACVVCWAERRLNFSVSTLRKTRAIAVQLPPQTIKRLDELAEASGMSRHRYMILILERAVKANVTVCEQVAFSNDHP